MAKVAEHLRGGLTRLPVEREHLLDGGRVGDGRRLKHSLYCTRDAQERYLSGEKCLDGDLVGGIEGDGVRAAFFRGFVGEAQAGKALEIRSFEGELAERGHVEGEVRGDALGPSHGVEDGQAHVSDRDLREEAAVDVFDQRVHGGLGVHGDFDGRGREVKEAAGLDDFEALVEHGGRVDGDAASHDPGGVLEGLGDGDVFEFGEREGTERAAGGGEPDLLDFWEGAGAHALVDGVVLGVDGEQREVFGTGGGGEEFAGGDHGLLVGEADGFSCEDGGVGGFEPGNADDGRDDEIDLREGGHADGSGGAVDDFDAGDAGGFEAGGEVSGEFFGRHGDDGRAPAAGLLEGEVEVAASGERGNGETLGEAFDDAEGALADGTGRAEDGNVLQRHELFSMD